VQHACLGALVPAGPFKAHTDWLIVWHAIREIASSLVLALKASSRISNYQDLEKRHKKSFKAPDKLKKKKAKQAGGGEKQQVARASHPEPKPESPDAKAPVPDRYIKARDQSLTEVLQGPSDT